MCNMKIAIFSDVSLPTLGGVSTAIQDITHALGENGHQVLVIVPKPQPGCDPKEFKVHKNARIYWAPSIDFRFYPEFRIGLPNLKILNQVKKFKPDVIHTHTPFALGFQGLVLARRLKIPVLTTHHTNLTDVEQLKTFNLYESKIAAQFQKGIGKLISFFLNKHQLVIVPTKDTLTDIRKLGVEKPAMVVPSPVDIQSLRTAKDKGKLLRTHLGIRKACLYVGRLSGEKNIDLVIQAFALARKKIPSLKLVLIGDGPDRGRLFQLASDLEVSESIIWTGKIPRDRLINQGYFYLGDVFMTLSKYETQGLSTVEAMACGLPVIGAKARATHELVKGTGILVDTNDITKISQKLVGLLNDSQQMKKLKQQSLDKADQFDPKRVIVHLEKAYNKVLKV